MKLTTLFAAALMMATTTTDAAGTKSGLPWASGAKCARPGFEQWRGRREDIEMYSITHKNWKTVVSETSRLVQSLDGHPWLSVTIPMLTDDTRADWSDCIAGKFDTYMRQIAGIFRARGLPNTVIRLGPEANGSGFPWNILGHVTEYKACWQREVKALRSVEPSLKMDWAMRKSTEGSSSVAQLYPGDKYVDIVGVSYYDRFWTTLPPWQDYANSTYLGGPQGIYPFWFFAHQHHKKISVPEWGIWNEAGHGTDNAFYIQKMYQFFQFAAEKGDMAYETYFNCDPAGSPRHEIYPGLTNPKASAMYRTLWKRGN